MGQDTCDEKVQEDVHEEAAGHLKGHQIGFEEDHDGQVQVFSSILNLDTIV